MSCLRRAPRSPSRPLPPPATASAVDGRASVCSSECSSNAKKLHLLLRSRHLHPALDFFLSLPPAAFPDHAHNALLRRLAASVNLRAAVRIFRRIPSPSTFSFNSLLAALLRRGRTRAAAVLFDEMVACAIRPDVCTFNTLVRGFCLNSMVDEAFRVFHDMPRHGCAPDVVTYNTLLDGLCRAGKVSTAHNLLNGMRMNSSDLAPNVVSYTTVIRGYCGKLLPDEAAGLFENMIAGGLKPNRITYNTLIKGLCEAKRMDLVRGILERAEGNSKDLTFKPDTCTFNTIISAHCNVSNTADAMKVFERMTQLRVKADSATYSTLICGLCEKGEFGRAEELVDELLEKEVLGRKGGSRPLLAAYNPIFWYLCEEGRTEKARRLLRQLLDRSAKLDHAAFKTVILGHCKEGAFKQGYELLVSMVKRDLVPDMETFEILIRVFLQKGNVGFLWETLKKMLNCGHRPSTSTFHSVLMELLKKNDYAEKAGELLCMMFERKIRQNIDLSTEVVDRLITQGLVDRAFQILKLIYDSGYSVKMEKLITHLCENKKFLEVQEIMLFGLKKDLKFNIQIFDVVVRGLCASGRTPEAFALFYEANERTLSFPLNSLSTLKLSLEKDGRSKEAEFVGKQIKLSVNGTES